MFTSLCLNFQKNIDNGKNRKLGNLLSEKEYLENEIQLLTKRNNSLQNSVSAFVEEELEDLCNSNSGNDLLTTTISLIRKYNTFAGLQYPNFP